MEIWLGIVINTVNSYDYKNTQVLQIIVILCEFFLNISTKNLMTRPLGLKLFL